MKKKLIIFNPSIEDGGVEKNLYLITNYLSKKNYKITLISADISKKKKFHTSIKFIHPKYINFKNAGRYKKYFFCSLLLAKQLITNKSSLVFSFQANIYSIIITKLLLKKIIVRLNTAPQGWDHNFLKNKIYKFFIQKADSIIVNSKKFKDEVERRYKINSHLILNPFDFNEIKKKSKQKINIKFLKKRDLKIINVARLTNQKDHLTLLKAVNIVKKFRNIQLIIIGKGICKNKILEFINENNLCKNVKLVGFKENPFKYIAKCDVFVLTSIFEGHPNVLVETLSLKKFVISSNCPTGPEEILNNGKYGDLFKPKDFKKLAKLLIKFKYNYINKKKVINGYKSLRIYDHKKQCKKYLDIIENNN